MVIFLEHAESKWTGGLKDKKNRFQQETAFYFIPN